MRIISGKYKGQYLVSFNASHIRPTTDRVKESLFNILMGDMDGARVLDLFSGTGGLGLEALSRDAANVTFVESNRKSIDILKQNIQKLKISDGYEIVQKDVINFLNKYEGDAFDIIFADPPFTEKMAHVVMQAASKTKAVKQNTIITIESALKERIDADYDILYRYDVREFGDKVLSFFKMK